MAENHLVFKFEELLPYFGVGGEADVYEITPPGGAPTTIIRTDQAWKVRFHWRTYGKLNCVLCGKWNLRIYLEEMGKGEFDLPGATASVAFVSAPTDYEKDIVIPAGVVPEGIYKLVVSITHTVPSGEPGPIAGFAEGPLLQFYKTCV